MKQFVPLQPKLPQTNNDTQSENVNLHPQTVFYQTQEVSNTLIRSGGASRPSMTDIEVYGLQEDIETLSKSSYHPTFLSWQLPGIPKLFNAAWRERLLDELTMQNFDLLQNIEIANIYLKRGQEKAYQLDWLARLIQEDQVKQNLTQQDIVQEEKKQGSNRHRASLELGYILRRREPTNQKIEEAIKIADLYLKRGQASGYDTSELSSLILEDQNGVQQSAFLGATCDEKSLRGLIIKNFDLLQNIEIANIYLKRGQEKAYQLDWLARLIQEDQTEQNLIREDISQKEQQQGSTLSDTVLELGRGLPICGEEAIKIADLYLKRGQASGCDTSELSSLILEEQNAMMPSRMALFNFNVALHSLEQQAKERRDAQHLVTNRN